MNLAVSNIAWSPRLEDPALTLLRSLGIAGVEVAPTRIWPDWKIASVVAAVTCRRRYATEGFSVPALQAILFGKPELKLFGTDSEREGLIAHLDKVAHLAQAIGARSLVFGAPSNRQLNGMPHQAAFDLAREFFATVATYYHRCGVCLCVEANPVQYGCSFAVDSGEAARLVRAVNSPGLRLHLDTACMFLAGEDIATAIRDNADVLSHFHVSEPFLASFSAPVIDHVQAFTALRAAGYEGWISLEMRETENPILDLRRAAEFLVQTYGEG